MKSGISFSDTPLKTSIISKMSSPFFNRFGNTRGAGFKLTGRHQRQTSL